jgi:hypothetical protein
MESLDMSTAWFSLVWIALAFGAAWLLNMLAERDAAASQPEQPFTQQSRKEAAVTGRLPAAD